MTDGEPSAEADRAAVETTWRLESAQLIATLARLTGDLGAAEDLAHDALVAALESWPTTGIPQSPGAWLTTTARRRALDALRRAPMLDRAHAEIARDHEAPDAAAKLIALTQSRGEQAQASSDDPATSEDADPPPADEAPPPSDA